MKTLSIRPGMAMAITEGEKTIEWRSWKTEYRGDICIHSSSPKDRCGLDIKIIPGHILAVAELYDIRPFKRKMLDDALMEWMPEPAGYGWILRNVRRLSRPIPAKGKLHLWEYTGSLDIMTDDSDFEKYWMPLLI